MHNEYLYMTACLQEIQEALATVVSNAQDAMDSVTSLRKTIDEFYLPCPPWDEVDMENEYSESQDD